jgi:3-hydroxypropanoate dehydrogenase
MMHQTNHVSGEGDPRMTEHKKIDSAALAQIFTEARTHNGFLDQPVSDELLREAIDIAKIGPTSANMSPMRVIFLKSPAAKKRLEPFLAPGNLAKTMAAPVTAIAAHDIRFYEHLPFLMPHVDAKAWFSSLPDEALREIAHKNGTLQVAYLILALRAVGLDTGPMTGFDNAKVDAEFFPGGQVKSNILINIGYGSGENLFPRSPRFSFDQIATIA